MIDETFDYADYLSAKKLIDDVSLNADVWRALTDWVRNRQISARPIRILEIGAGTGTMIERFLRKGLISHCRYTAVEQEPTFRNTAFERLGLFARSHAFTASESGDDRRVFRNGEVRVELEWLTGDVLTMDELIPVRSQDLIVAHAVVDLLPVPACMPKILSRLKPGGGFYFSLNFAGQTDFLPGHLYDECLSGAYHGDMDKRFPDLDWRPSRTGQTLGRWLTATGNSLVCEGPSDWILPDARIPQEVSLQFMSNILDTIAKALAGLPGLEDWLNVRRRQLADGSLRFRAANTDLFGLTSGAPGAPGD